MGLLQGLTPRPVSVDVIDAQLPQAWEQFEKACADFVSTQTVRSLRVVAWAQVTATLRRVNELLDRRCEVQRAKLLEVLEGARHAQGLQLRDWWMASYPGTPPPTRPEEDVDAA